VSAGVLRQSPRRLAFLEWVIEVVETVATLNRSR